MHNHDYVEGDIEGYLQFDPSAKVWVCLMANPFNRNEVSAVQVDYCPWCGEKLPTNIAVKVEGEE